MERKLISANAVRILCGDISDMTMWRWLNNPALDFPRPIYIGPRRYWREAEVTDWLASRPAA
ncbi:transcriptional regulator, AlpA family [Paracoccus halophilus]|uniref:Transcriptional regulator, AlpA family n=1 Tax=Paracoccus halophilus TaxID=376733 RepID=A0A1I0SJG7_9RHOB|nr:AlpA family phage regulatory protein [Paracoccus halophilus]SFA39612.1 transcriptional regulator, AlpA family [Paracoccus halophilus]